nr:hypothetical protein [Chloroflexota bacterium]
QRPLGGGPFRLVSYQPGKAVELQRHDGHVPEPASLERIRLLVVRDAAVATTALRAGDVDWVVRLTPEQAAGLAGDAKIRVAAHPEPVVRAIIFNVRPGRVYADAVTRRAFGLCIDRERASAAAPGASPIPSSVETTLGSWALGGAAPAMEPDPAVAVTLLEEAGWQRGSDGIFARGAMRLSSEVGVRTGRPDLLGLLQAVSEQLHACGIELGVRELDASTDALLERLQWPNDFETLLLARPLASDPAADFAAFEGSRVTSRDNPTDANPGGHSSPALDALLAAALTDPDPDVRAGHYTDALLVMAQDPPSLPLVYDVAHAAISHRVQDAAGMGIDPSAQRYAWDVWSWRAP